MEKRTIDGKRWLFHSILFLSYYLFLILTPARSSLISYLHLPETGRRKGRVTIPPLTIIHHFILPFHSPAVSIGLTLLPPPVNEDRIEIRARNRPEIQMNRK